MTRMNSDLVGLKFGRLVVKAESDRINGKRMWQCFCECGETVIAQGNNLRSGHTKSCGCFRSEKTSQRTSSDLTNMVFGKLTVLERGYEGGVKSDQHSQWLCLCECGNTTITSSRFLTSGHTKSCGCYRRDNESLFQYEEQHPSWKGGVSSHKPSYRGRKEFRLWRKAVFQRDNHTCQSCGTKDGELHAHHLKSWAECPELRLAIDNGLTLCEPCHMAWHKENRKVIKLQSGGQANGKE